MQKLQDSQAAIYPISFVNKKGNPAAIDGDPQVVSSNEEVAAGSITKNEDGSYKLTVKAGIPGTARVTITADADLGEGVQQIAGSEDFDVVAGSAISVKFGTPEIVEQETPAPNEGGGATLASRIRARANANEGATNASVARARR